MMKPYKFIAIEGNIGAGKTTLATYLKDLLKAELLLERFEENPYLKDFYQDRDKFAFETESFFLKDRISQLQQHFWNTSKLTVADFSIYKSLVFSKITLREEYLKEFMATFEASIEQLPRPDLIIYLKSDTDRIKQQILKRGREYEKNIEETYLKLLGEAYELQWKSHSFLNVLEITADNLIFPYKNEQMRKLRNYIEITEIKGFTRLNLDELP